MWRYAIKLKMISKLKLSSKWESQWHETDLKFETELSDNETKIISYGNKNTKEELTLNGLKITNVNEIHSDKKLKSDMKL